MTVIWYLLPGLFLLPQICDFPPFHIHIQMLDGLWYPLRCMKFHELHGGAVVAIKKNTVRNIHENVPLTSVRIPLSSVLYLDLNTPMDLKQANISWYQNQWISELFKPILFSKSSQTWLALIIWLKASAEDLSWYLSVRYNSIESIMLPNYYLHSILDTESIFVGIQKKLQKLPVASYRETLRTDCSAGAAVLELRYPISLRIGTRLALSLQHSASASKRYFI